jgi:trehalose-6-phosphate synthase
MSLDQHATESYRRVNKIFADNLLADMKDGDSIWVQDYHLMLLPLLLRKQAKESGINIRIGFFLHTPFPSEDFFTMLPSKTEILDGILGADVIGFHTDENRRHFLFCCSEIL